MNKKSNEFYLTQTIYEQIFTSEECDRILEHAEVWPEIQAETFYANNSEKGKSIVNTKTRITKIKILTDNPEAEWVVQRIISRLEKLNDEFYKMILSKLEDIQFLKYEESGYFNWHVDSGSVDFPYSKRKLSLIIFLSDRNDYEGGQLEMSPATKEKIPMEKGYMILFSSNKVHRVTPVNKGVRYTLVTWALCD